MPNHHELPGGHWVQLKDPMEITERERKPLRRAQLALSRSLRGPAKARGSEAVNAPDPTQPPEPEEPSVPDDERLEALDAYTHELMVFFVEAWDFPQDATTETVQDLPVPVYRELDNLVSPLASEVLFGIKLPDPPEDGESHPSEP